VLFVGFAGLQLNDPDPLAWVAVYLAAAALGVAEALGRGLRRGVWLFVGPVLAGVAWLAPAAVQAPPAAILSDWDMVGPGVEEAREALGLLIVAVWGSWLALRKAAAPRPKNQSP
jgi:Transmembrane family 220, helix